MVLLLALFVLACTAPSADGDDSAASIDSGVPAGPSGPGRVENSCAPDDGLAARIIVGLAEEGCDGAFSDVAHVRITLWGDATWPLVAGTYPFDSGTGSAWYAPAAGDPEQYATEGEVVVSSASGGVVTGTYTLELDSGEAVAGTFTAEACETGEMCG